MPTKTFLNLPNEKKSHLIESALKEFTHHTLMDASINKIIQDAKIPRGSFYQYFENKEDLYFYTFATVKESIAEGVYKTIQKTDDLSSTFLKIYDFLYHYIVDSNSEEYYKNVMITFHKLETVPNKEEPIFDTFMRQELKDKLALSEEDANNILDILSFALGRAIIHSLKDKHAQPDIRKRFISLLEIFKYGYIRGGDK